MSFAAGFARRLFGQVWQRQHSQVSGKAPLLNNALKGLGQVRLVSENGQDCGVMPVAQALNRAREFGVDLMQVGRGETPVVKLVNYAAIETARRKSTYDKRKQNKETRMLDRREGILKQVRLSPAMDRNDMQVKMRQATEFLKAGYRIKVFMQFRKGHGRLEEDAKAALVAAAEKLQEVGLVQGLEKDRGLQDLFAVKKVEEEKEGIVKKKPLEFFMRPLPRKQREQLVRETSSTQEIADV